MTGAGWSRAANLNKALLRTELRGRRRQLSNADRVAAGSRLSGQVLTLRLPSGPVATYASYAAEPPTKLLNSALTAAGYECLYPVVDGLNLTWATGKLLTSSLGIPHPQGPPLARSANDLMALGVVGVLVPALAVSHSGLRLGQGGGYYDRALMGLPRWPAGPVRAAIVYDFEVLPSLPTEPHDEPVDVIVTPDRTIDLR